MFSAIAAAAISLSAADEQGKAVAKDAQSQWGVGQAVVDAQRGDESVQAAGASSQVTITDDGCQYDERSQAERYMNRLFRINTGSPLIYALSLSVHQKKDEKGEWTTLEASVGMPSPSYSNWYHSAFFGIAANNRSIHTQAPKVEVEIVETGERGIIDFNWEHPLVAVRTRFIADLGADHLLMELRWKAKDALRTLKIGFCCYPQGYRVGEPDRLKGLGLSRCVTTPEGRIPQGQNQLLDPSSDWWLLYHDIVNEKSRQGANFSGPCALMFVPDEWKETLDNVNPERIRLNVTDYQVETEFDLDLGLDAAHFAIWDFGESQAVVKAREKMLAEAPKVLERMRKGSWLPTPMQNLDLAAERRRVDELAGKAGPKNEERMKALRQQLELLAARQKELSSGKDYVGAEHLLSAALTSYRTLFWQAERPFRKDMRVLFLAGPTAYAWRVEEVVKKRWGADAVRRGGYIWKYWIGHRVSYFPGTLTELYSYDVVVIADFAKDPLAPDQLQWLTDFVRQGGGLLMLGGYYAYGPGGWAESPLEPLLPVQVGKGFDLQEIKPERQLKPVEVKADSRLKPRKPLAAENLGCAYWRHNLKPKDGTVVWLTAGDQPFAVSGAAGEGRAMAIMGTALGEAPAGQTAFWDSPGWEPLLAEILGYLAGGEQ